MTTKKSQDFCYEVLATLLTDVYNTTYSEQTLCTQNAYIHGCLNLCPFRKGSVRLPNLDEEFGDRYCPIGRTTKEQAVGLFLIHLHKNNCGSVEEKAQRYAEVSKYCHQIRPAMYLEDADLIPRYSKIQNDDDWMQSVTDDVPNPTWFEENRAAYWSVIMDVVTAYNEDRNVFDVSPRNLRLTINWLKRRFDSQGMGLLTKTLPALGKAFDRALSGERFADVTALGFKTFCSTRLPRFLGELFCRVLDIEGGILDNPCVKSVRNIRQILYSFYKYELPYTDEQELEVVSKFKDCETTLSCLNPTFADMLVGIESGVRAGCDLNQESQQALASRARSLLERVFHEFDPYDIHPRHGPGAVATKQQPHEKYQWTNVSKELTEHFPFDEYFCSSPGEVCDTYEAWSQIGEEKLPARVILVPKDSRGPRLISAEPVDHQWIQQGLGQAIVNHIETNPITRWNVFYTNQVPNRCGAILGSKTGKYATLDLAEASDRVHLGLVRLLFPKRLVAAMESCRSSSTELPTGEIIVLNKFAPMGSSLCFPILGLTIWALLTANAPDTHTRERILVYGDDVIVPTTYVVDAIHTLESFGLKVNRDKTCDSGSFRESCGADAFAGELCTPVKFKTVWTSTRRADVYESYIAYSNELFTRGYTTTANLIAEELIRIYGPIPGQWQVGKTAPALCWCNPMMEQVKKRWNKDTQKHEYLVLCSETAKYRKSLPGWRQLARFFAERGPSLERDWHRIGDFKWPLSPSQTSEVSNWVDQQIPSLHFNVSIYTRRGRSILRRRWRG